MLHSRTLQSCTRPNVQQPLRSAVPKPVCSRRHVARASTTGPTLVDTMSSTDSLGQPARTNLDALVARFKAFDIDGNGKIDREELRHLLESMDGGNTVMLTDHHWLPDSELDRVMQTYDKDGNGLIDFEEFQNIVYDGLLLPGELNDYEEAFSAVDKSGNGTIGAMELHELFDKLGYPLTYEKLSDLMLQYDRDESGQIEFGEFLLMFRDQLLDLKEMQNYITSSAADGKGNTVLGVKEGEISVIFSKKELDEALSKKDKLTVVFSAMTWCRPCKSMQRPAQKLAAHYKEGLRVVKIFGNSNQQTKELFKKVLKIRSTPCFMVFNGEELLYTQTGRNQSKLEDALRGYLEEVNGKLPANRVFAPEETAPAATAATAAA